MARTPLMLVVAALAAALPGQNPWAKSTPTASPSMRRAGAMGFDGTTNRLILQGGTTQTPSAILNETWSYNGTTWTQLLTAGGPARWGHQMVRIPSPTPSQNRLLTFGGRSPTIGALANDTWQFNGTTWTQVLTPGAPTPRFRHGLAFDTVRSRAVLFGGRAATGTVGDTWEFDGVTWAQVTTTNAPPPREDMALVFDPILNRTILFGGYDADTDTLYGDTWEFDGTDWRDVTPSQSPPSLFRMASIYDATRKRIVLYGGFDGVAFRTQTYEYTGGAWTLVLSATGTLFSTEMYSAYDSQRRKFVTFGGVGTAFSDETWEYTGVNTPLVSLFGEGCDTSAGATGVTATILPRINQTYTLQWTNLPPAAGFVLAVHGLTNISATPIDLAIIGFTGCNLLVSPDILRLDLADIVDPTVALSPFALPNDPTLLNVVLYSQALVFDANATNGAGGASLGVRAIIGS